MAEEKNIKKERKGLTLREILAGEFLTRDTLVRQVPFLFFLVLLFFIQISMIYYFESIQIDMKRTQETLNDLNSEYSTNASELSVKSQHSQVMDRVRAIGLENSPTTPFIVDVDSNFFKLNHE